MKNRKSSLLHIGIKGHVVALDRASGEEVWRTHLKGSNFVTVSVDRGLVLAATRGEMFALDPMSGRIIWNNRLRGLGLGIVGLATVDAAGAAQQIGRDDAAAAGAAAAAS